ncbi:hypothetical protein Tamer19_24770 [Cupriavidus sp. TA19]|nr:hypothetical protein Tamer19_24770 [Cupriavidus sp. TA19]
MGAIGGLWVKAGFPVLSASRHPVKPSGRWPQKWVRLPAPGGPLFRQVGTAEEFRRKMGAQ